MPNSIDITFLGTAAGKPSATRNVSSLVVRVDSDLWVVDAGEGTQHQLMRSKLKMSKITHIFVTHMHGDHVYGLPGLLGTISAGEGGVLLGKEDPRVAESQRLKPIEIYGPCGLREFMRTNMRLSRSVLTRPYVVHELLLDGEQGFGGDLHVSERQGRDIQQRDGVWTNFASVKGVDISAGPILHTIPCLGYVFQERPRPEPLQPTLYVPHLQKPVNAAALASQGITNPLSVLSRLTQNRETVTLADGTVLEPPPMGAFGRKLVILGDTYDASGCLTLAQDADVVVHESTNAYLPDIDDSQKPGKRRGDGVEITRESVRLQAREHGHSTPEVAGGFAKRVNAKMLLLNHLSVKYPAVSIDAQEGEGDGTRSARSALDEIESLASAAWGGGRAIAARDFQQIDIPRRDAA
ncbi:hypothetical protein ACM66B_000456 [Microbotryomycetes sp. NB124-2]